MSFITNQFWISLYMQQVQNLQPIIIAVRLLPQAIAGILWSYICQALVHRINGTILMGIGGLAYFVGALIQIFIRQDTSYWQLLFPALIITVLGADIQFIVSNVCAFSYLRTSCTGVIYHRLTFCCVMEYHEFTMSTSLHRKSTSHANWL